MSSCLTSCPDYYCSQGTTVTPIKKVRLSDSIIDAIREMISREGFKPGDKFYSEKQLTQKLEVSRSSIREALRMLEVSGQVSVRQGKGIFIMDPPEQQLHSFSTWLQDNEQDLLDHFEVRLMLEPKAAWHATLKATPEEVGKLDAICSAFARNVEKNDLAASIQDDRDFHRVLARATKNTTLHFVMKCMATSLPDGWISSLHTPGRMRKTIHEHGAILDAVKSCNPEEAKEAMINHLKNAIEDIRAVYHDRDTPASATADPPAQDTP